MDINEIIRLALVNTTAEYVVRDAGSFVTGQTRDKQNVAGGQEIKDWLAGLTWAEETDAVREGKMGFGQCRYGVAHIDEGAFECIAEWGSLTPEQQEQVVIRRSPHASDVTKHLNELLLSSVQPTPTYRISIAVGNGADPFAEITDKNATVFFWAPGRFTRFTVVSDEMAADRSLIPPWATVKLGG